MFLSIYYQAAEIDASTAVPIGIILAIATAYISIQVYRRNFTKDIKSEGASSGQLLSDMGYIKSGVDDIKRKQEVTEKNYVDVICRVVAVEGSAKQAHHRIDNIEQKSANNG